MATSTLGSGTLVLAGTTSGTTTVTATAVAGTTTLTLPAATDTLVGRATTDTLTNKTLTGAVMNGTLGATTPSTGAFTTMSATTGAAVGGATPGAGGLAFPATAVAVADANTLDDYEEGTWTPNQGSGLTVVGAFSSSGTYTKIGSVVIVTGILFGATSIRTGALGLVTTNLPFAQGTGNWIGRCLDSVWASSTDIIVSAANIYSATATTANTYIFFSVTYRV